MSKGILQFDLPEEQEEFKECVNASDTKAFLHTLDNELRSVCKHGSDDVFGEKFKTVTDLCWNLRDEISKYLYEEY